MRCLAPTTVRSTSTPLPSMMPSHVAAVRCWTTPSSSRIGAYIGLNIILSALAVLGRTYSTSRCEVPRSNPREATKEPTPKVAARRYSRGPSLRKQSSKLDPNIATTVLFVDGLAIPGSRPPDGIAHDIYLTRLRWADSVPTTIDLSCCRL
ncbi:hypothetical protein D9619_013357 [Psilocybe cf. subviscida]|uniref:Uncharacterized protein n=1 Tax=Psilocybe cf. subviscida TaxID=2480587 RepID=A0A8H5BSB4_9AGAR|nr:hypothetical protein D9619_013357 [Psilocybe cf. subviscida]